MSKADIMLRRAVAGAGVAQFLLGWVLMVASSTVIGVLIGMLVGVVGIATYETARKYL